jgi:hypothetical protein
MDRHDLLGVLPVHAVLAGPPISWRRRSHPPQMAKHPLPELGGHPPFEWPSGQHEVDVEIERLYGSAHDRTISNTEAANDNNN